MEKKEKIRSKNIGQVLTPQYLVEEMLDYAGYKNTAIIEKHIIDNSCGDGAFLQVAVKRYCEEALRAGKNGRGKRENERQSDRKGRPAEMPRSTRTPGKPTCSAGISIFTEGLHGAASYLCTKRTTP